MWCVWAIIDIALCNGSVLKNNQIHQKMWNYGTWRNEEKNASQASYEGSIPFARSSVSLKSFLNPAVILRGRRHRGGGRIALKSIARAM